MRRLSRLEKCQDVGKNEHRNGRLCGEGNGDLQFVLLVGGPLYYVSEPYRYWCVHQASCLSPSVPKAYYYASEPYKYWCIHRVSLLFISAESVLLSV